MKEQLNLLTRELEEIKQENFTTQEKKEDNILYKKELRNTIDDVIIQAIEEGQEKAEPIKNVYKKLIVDDSYYIDAIYNELYNYKLITKRYMKDKYEKTMIKEFCRFPFQTKDIYHDIEQLYYTKINANIKKYQLKESFRVEEVLKELEDLFKQYYDKLGYKSARQTLYNQENKNIIIKATKRRSQNIIEQNYYKILNEVDKLHKITHPEQAKTIKTTTQTSTLNKRIKHKPAILLTAFTLGVLKGFKNTIK